MNVNDFLINLLTFTSYIMSVLTDV